LLPGEHVSAGAEPFVLESMKMEISVEAEATGCIDAYHNAEGQAVAVAVGQTIEALNLA
jgi:acetyl-CoA carboxylase biotin carboxyl carrier protein